MKPSLVRWIAGLAAVAALSLIALVPSPGQAASKNGGHIDGTVSFAKGNSDMVVYVDKAAGSFKPSAKHALMNQLKMTFVPHVLPVLVGTTVDFLNSDSVSHNVFSPDNEGYNLGSWGKGQKRSYTFKQVGVYTQLCSLHPEMLGYIVVLQNPYFAVTDKDGHFRITGLPEGHYVLKVWGEKLKSKDKKKTFAVDLHGDSATTSISF